MFYTHIPLRGLVCQTSIMRQALVYQAEIAANTKLSASELTEIKTTLKRIENKDSSLLSQGIA